MLARRSAAAAVGGLTVWYFGRDLPDYQQLADYQPPIVTRVHAGDGRLLAEYATEKRVFVPVQRDAAAGRSTPSSPPRTRISTPIPASIRCRCCAPAIADIVAHRHAAAGPIGASTITQQVAKNFLLSNEVSFERKIKEALLAIRMEQALSKDRILELYLNEIYLGGGTYGVAAAALNYFDKSLDELTLEEAAFLAALPKAPNNYNPAAQSRGREGAARLGARPHGRGRLHHRRATARRRKARADRAAPARRDRDRQRADYFTEEVRRELVARYGEKGLYEGGLSVRTSLDPRLQAIAEHALRDALDRL